MKKILMIAAAAAFVISGMATTASAAALGKCKACHSFDSGGKDGTGPNLFGIVGRTMGGVEGFKYGSYLTAQKEAGATWNADNLRAWIDDTKGVAKAAHGSTKMPSQKLKGDKADAAIAALEALK